MAPADAADELEPGRFATHRAVVRDTVELAYVRRDRF
jgi:hypothetical protein